MDTPDAQPPYGARLLAALRRYGMGFAGLKYAEVQALKTADREEVIRLLSHRGMGLTYSAKQILRNEEPEQVALMMRQDQVTRAMMWLVILG
ncbi:MAG: hypothetical protein R3F33_06055 [Planctomycetota bacterium]